MSVPQRDQYLQECSLLFECLHGNNSQSDDSHREEKSIVVKNDSDFDDNSDGDNDDDEIDNDDYMSEKKHKVSKNVSKKGRKLDNSKGMNALGIGSGVLPNIMQLRQICDFATWNGDLDSHGDNEGGHRSGATTDEDKENVQLSDSNYSSNDHSSDGFRKEEEREKERQYLKRRQSTERYVIKLLQNSGKLKVLDELLTSIKQLNPPEKVVIVSNFTSSLDALEAIAKSHKWMFLRYI
jgi:hypothetical protein